MEKFIVNLSSDSNEYMTVYKVSKNCRSIRDNEDVKGLSNADINEAVYEAMKTAGQDIVDRCQVYLSGERTASELAGTVGGKLFHAVATDIRVKGFEMPKSIQITAGNVFSCCVHVDELFPMMANWEGMMGLKPKDCHKFHCQCDPKADRSKELKAYKRSVYTAGRVSVAWENQKIYNKFKALEPLTASLTSEGMKKCLSCLTAIEAARKKYTAEERTAVKGAMFWKLWDDYHREGYYQPREFSAKDFQDAPDIWKQVDEDYVKELLAYYDALLRKADLPKWARKDAEVRFVNQDTTPAKWQGRLRVRCVYLNYYRTSSLYHEEKSVGWVAEVCTTKGRYDVISHSVKLLEPWEDEKKPKAKAKTKAKAEPKPKAEPKKKKEPVKTELSPEALALKLRETLIRLTA
jgi:hypothetical protein